MITEITIDKDSFDYLHKEVLKQDFYCTYCGVKLNKHNFSVLQKDNNCCDNIICIMKYCEHQEEENLQ